MNQEIGSQYFDNERCIGCGTDSDASTGDESNDDAGSI
jgi:hypothetical protein